MEICNESNLNYKIYVIRAACVCVCMLMHYIKKSKGTFIFFLTWEWTFNNSLHFTLWAKLLSGFAVLMAPLRSFQCPLNFSLMFLAWPIVPKHYFQHNNRADSGLRWVLCATTKKHHCCRKQRGTAVLEVFVLWDGTSQLTSGSRRPIKSLV